jgi:hypothetical protein
VIDKPLEWEAFVRRTTEVDVTHPYMATVECAQLRMSSNSWPTRRLAWQDLVLRLARELLKLRDETPRLKERIRVLEYETAHLRQLVNQLAVMAEQIKNKAKDA